MTTQSSPPPERSPEARVVKRYSNRKLYDTVESRYVTLPQIAELVRKGEEVRIIDNKSKEDLTRVTLAQILYEEERKQSSPLPIGTFKELLNTARERMISTLPPVARFIGRDEKEAAPEVIRGDSPPVEATPEAPGEGPAPAKEPGRVQQFLEESRVAVDQWQHEADKRMRAFWEGINPNSQIVALQAEVRRLQQRVEALEARLATHESPSNARSPSASDDVKE